ncbi:TetR family transcriptional regulator [Streptomyces sp. NPDC049577]|uniref:TetR/AcrR family transcriptional regulator n=1 Tax=Streptomyces sp. NPDC049577 TaxID=3155153 RepID=UPI00344104F6
MTGMAAAQTSPAAEPEPGPRLGLRERKKIQTRQAIRRAAYRLFAEHGYDATPVDRIAEAADVSPSTVFRYFPTKEDIVLTDEYDPLVAAAILARPADEPPVEAIRQGLLTAMRQILDTDLDEFRQRMRLVREVPALRGRSAEGMAQSAEPLCRVLAERAGRPAADLEMRVATAAILGAMQETMMYWVDRGQTDDPLALMERGLHVLGRGLVL